MTDLQQRLPNDQNFGLCVDEFVSGLEKAKYELRKNRIGLLDHGVKIVDANGYVMSSPGLDVMRYMRCGGQEFAWEAEYADGSVVRQFEEEGAQHHFGDIDQTRLRFFRWVSNFVTETDNVEKRAIVTLDFKSQTWAFLNAFVKQETRGEIPVIPPGFVPKLIMKMVKRQSAGAGVGDADAERYLYNRYIVGFEAAESSPVPGKVLLCVEPNGYVHFWHDKK